MKNFFYFTIKALFLINTFKFCPDFFGHIRKGLNKKAKVYFKIYDVTNWGKKYIYCPISHQTIKFGQLIEYNMPNICLQISYRK